MECFNPTAWSFCSPGQLFCLSLDVHSLEVQMDTLNICLCLISLSSSAWALFGAGSCLDRISFCFIYDIKFLQNSASMKQELERQGLPPFPSHQVCWLCKDLPLQCQMCSYSPQSLVMDCAYGLNPTFLCKIFSVCGWGTLCCSYCVFLSDISIWRD